MSNKYYIAAGAAVFVLLILVIAVRRRRRRRNRTLDTSYFLRRWKELQKNCASRKTWPKAIIEADELLDEALKKLRYKGKTTGERLVAAQHDLSDNESVWFGHKYCKRVPDEDVRKLRKQDILEALNGFRQALRDLGALEVPNDRP
jgi:hypothetical protein